jgi:hypothetical protein
MSNIMSIPPDIVGQVTQDSQFWAESAGVYESGLIFAELTVYLAGAASLVLFDYFLTLDAEVRLSQ